MKRHLIQWISCFIPTKKLRQKFRKKLGGGRNNVFTMVLPNGKIKHNPKIKGLKVLFYGENSKVTLYAPLPKFENCVIHMGDNAEFILHESNRRLREFTVWRMRNGTKLEIGKGFSCEKVQIAMQCEDNLKVNIGDDCMFSHDVYIQPSDSHAIIDKTSSAPLNFGKDIIIGNNVWLSPYVFVLKGVEIADWTVVGANSVVSKSIEEPNTVNVGSPCRKIKSDVIWSRFSAFDYKKRMCK